MMAAAEEGAFNGFGTNTSVNKRTLPQSESTARMLPDDADELADDEKTGSTILSAPTRIISTHNPSDQSPPSGVKNKLNVDFGGQDGGPLAPQQQHYPLYRRRYWVLAIFVAYSMSNAFQWIEFAIVGNVVADYYGVSRLAVEWTSMMYMVSYIPLIFPGAWFLEKYGLRLSMILGSAGTAIGAWIKVFGIGPDGFTWVFVGQTVAACSQVFVLGIPPHLAAQWFGPNELSTATAVGVFGNQLGIALGFFVPPMLVPASDDTDEIRLGFALLFYTIAGLSTAITVLVLIVVRDRAPTPCSAAQAVVQSSGTSPSGKQFFKSIAKLVFRHRGYALLLITYGLNVGVFYAISTLLNPMLLAHYPGAEKDAGIIGSVFVIAGMVGSVVCGVIMDRTHKYKETALGVYIMSLVGMGLYGCSFPFGQLPVVYVTAIAVGFFMTGYLPVGFEFAAEITYPEAEGTTSGLLNASAQLFGLAVTWGASVLLDSVGTLVTNSILCAMLAAGSILTYFIPGDLRRRAAHAGADSTVPVSSAYVI